MDLVIHLSHPRHHQRLSDFQLQPGGLKTDLFHDGFSRLGETTIDLHGRHIDGNLLKRHPLLTPAHVLGTCSSQYPKAQFTNQAATFSQRNKLVGRNLTA